MREFIKLETDPCDVIRLFPNLFPKDSVATKLNQSTLVKSNLPALDGKDGKDLEMALLALIEYLTEVRFNLLRQMHYAETKANSKNSNDLLSIIDTTLLKCYLQVLIWLESWRITACLKLNINLFIHRRTIR